MRTPLHAILGFADMLLNEVDQPHNTDHVVSIKESGEALLELINDVLDFSRIESANMPLQISAIALLQLIDASARPFAAMARQKGIDLRYDVASECPALIRGDEQRLRQLLRNIVGNAVKFTHAGEVNIHVTCHGCEGGASELRIAVSDTGIGIAAEHIPHLFESFFQVDNGNDRVYAGTGLGLTIACMFAKLMGGSIEVSSELGKGSVFTLHFPLEQGQPIRTELVAPAVEKPAPRGLRVLLVEDNSVNRQLALIHLKGIECEVVMAENGQMAIDSFVRESFDIVLMDCQMPVMDGYTATELIRSHEALRGTHTPIIALTATAIHGQKEQCLAVGMDDVLTKPFSRSQFLEMIARWANAGNIVT
jgi:CheY-like chemotaxis protein/two-component sensor histidine kinase